MNFKRNKQLKTGWSTSALTDIVFLLLIFFLLTSSFVMQPGIKVDLPAAEKSDIKRKNIIVTITGEKDIYINQQRVSLQTYSVRLQEVLKSSGDKLVIFSADKSVDLGFFVRIMDISKAAGAQSLGISTKTKG